MGRLKGRVRRVQVCRGALKGNQKSRSNKGRQGDGKGQWGGSAKARQRGINRRRKSVKMVMLCPKMKRMGF